MSSLPKDLRARLDERYTLARPAVSRDQTSLDGSRKWLLRFADGNEAEAVFIPEEDRGALCVSSQVGCSLTCSFCHTGTQRLVRNLDSQRDRRPDADRPRRLRRVAEPGWPAAALQRRADGDGRAAAQLRPRRHRCAHPDGPGGDQPLAPAHHAVDRRRRAADPPGRRRARGEARGQPARGDRRASRRPRAHQPQVPAGRADGDAQDLSRRRQRQADHLRVRHAEGRQRQPGRRPGPGAAGQRPAVQVQPDPVQRLARLGLCLLLGGRR